MRDHQEETHVLVAATYTVAYQNVVALSMTEMLHYFHFQIKKKSQLFTNLGVMKYIKMDFTITKSTKVCELHFKPDEIKTTLGRGIKTWKTGVEVPSVYSFKKQKTQIQIQIN